MAKLSITKHGGKEKYLAVHGCHFNRPLYRWAVSLMEGRDGGKVTPADIATFREKMSESGVTIEREDTGYDGPYVWCMAVSDYLGSSIEDEKHLAQYVKDYIDDPDGPEGRAFAEFCARCKCLNVEIPWEDFMKAT